MDTLNLLSKAAHIVGPSGNEQKISKYFAEEFQKYVDDVYIDSMSSVIAHKKGTGPKVMLCAHQDEIALTVTKIEDNGSIRLGKIGGVDPRILPAARVLIHGKETLQGIIECVPPELNTDEEKKQAYALDDLWADTGLSAEKLNELVKPGDLVTFDVPLTELKNNQVACKTMDDRACVAMLVKCARRLSKMQCDADVYFVASSQEEVGGYGAAAASFNIHPDLAIAIDVDFASQPGCSDDETIGIDSLSVTEGPFISQKLLQRFRKCAKEHNVKLQTLLSTASTGTDADEIGIICDGVPCILLSLPEKYMHTTVETIDTDVVREGGRLLAHFLSELEDDWEEDLWI